MSAAPEVFASSVDPQRVLDHLHGLEERTASPRGAQRVAWTPVWDEARAQFRRAARDYGLGTHVDRAANLWAFAPGRSDEVVVLGSHLDSVPGGGWLDGALGVFSALEVVRALAADGPPAKTVAVVDWADEEGARFGRSLLGSSAFTGTLRREDLAALRDQEGLPAIDVVTAYGLDPAALGVPDPLLARMVAYLELHIEQGPVLEAAGLPLAAVTGTIGIERDRFVFSGQPAHAGPTPMGARRDAFLVAAEVALAAERAAIEAGGRATCGSVELSPGIPTVIAGETTLLVDLRHDDPAALYGLRAAVFAAAGEAARARGCGIRRERVWHIDPRPFDPRLVGLASEAVAVVSGQRSAMVSGALHDAGELAPLVPTAMIFCASRGGLSHCPEEDSAEADITLAVHALERLARRALEIAS